MKAEALAQSANVVTKEDLAELKLLAGANVAAVARLLRDCPVTLLAKDEVLLVPGSANHSLYLVLRGRLRVHLQSLNTTPLYIVEPGEAVGEISMIGEKPVAGYVVADEFARVLCINHELFWSLIYSERAVARNVLWMLAERMRAGKALILESMQAREPKRHASTVDDLTGLQNRATFEELLRRQATRCAMSNKPLALLIVGMESMQGFVHDFGVAAGNQAVSAVTKSLRELLRANDIIGRIGDWQFGIVMSECDGKAALLVAKRLCTEISEQVVTMDDGSILPPVSVSIGVAESRTLEKIQTLVSAAQEAFVRAHKLGCRVALRESF